MEKQVKIIKAWEYEGRKCLVLWLGSHFCGYGETKLNEVSYSQEFGDYETSPESNISAHGGITFAGKHDELKGNPFDKDIWYFGFDCAHAGDYNDFGVTISDKEGHKWTEEEVIKETEQMVNGIIEYEKVYNKYKKEFEKFKKEIKKIQDGKRN